MAESRLPTFLVIGAPKSGTTTLARYLGAHPDVYMAPEKELRYFDRRHREGPEWYLAHFARAGSEKAVGEATPTYMVDPDAPRRMAELLPDARLVAILRNPIERAYSHYWQVRRRGTDLRSFAEAMDIDDPRPLVPGPAQPGAYIGLGHYAAQLRNVAEHYPRAAIHVMILEEMVDAPEAVLSELHRFLGVEEAFTPPNLGEVFNASHSFRSWRLRKAMMRVRAWSIAPGLARRLDRLNRDEAAYPEMEPDVRARLEEHFAAPNRELASWLGREITAWSN